MPANPWLKKNPFMSMWLSGANTIANAARGQVAAAARRQSRAAVDKASQDMRSLWLGASTPGAPAARAKRRKKK
jgi:hypothetical protein